MVKEVRGYDTSIITLRGGHVVVWQGDDIGMEMVSGSKTTIRDVRLYPLSDREELVEFLLDESTANKKWCSMCGNYRERFQFSPDNRNRDRLHGYCKICRARYRRMKASKDRSGTKTSQNG